MTIDDKIYNRWVAVYKTRGIKPIGLVVDKATYIKLLQQPIAESYLDTNGPGQKYKDLLVSVSNIDEETIIVY